MRDDDDDDEGWWVWLASLADAVGMGRERIRSIVAILLLGS